MLRGRSMRSPCRPRSVRDTRVLGCAERLDDGEGRPVAAASCYAPGGRESAASNREEPQNTRAEWLLPSLITGFDESILRSPASCRFAQEHRGLLSKLPAEIVRDARVGFVDNRPCPVGKCIGRQSCAQSQVDRDL